MIKDIEVSSARTDLARTDRDGYFPPDGAHSVLSEIKHLLTPSQLATYCTVHERTVPEYNDYLVVLDQVGKVRIFGEEVRKGDSVYSNHGLHLSEFVRSKGLSAQAEWVKPNTFRDLTSALSGSVPITGKESTAEIAQLLKGLIEKADRLDASDIHIVMQRNMAYVRYRVHGVMVNDATPRPKSTLIAMYNHLYNYGYGMSSKDYDTANEANATVLVDLSSGLTTKWRFHSFQNEDREHSHVVLRRNPEPSTGSFFDVSEWDGYTEQNLYEKLLSLGYLPRHCKQIITMFSAPSGGVFIGGKTNSGKTTTLEIALSGVCALSKFQKVVITVEDVPELNIPLASRTPVMLDAENPPYKYNDAIRSTLRRDGNIIVIGEIRAADSGEAVQRAILTDHLVPASIHVNNLLSMFDRLEDLGVTKSFLAGRGRAAGFIWQKLIQRLCPHCKKPIDQASDISKRLIKAKISLNNVFTRNDKGCDHCNGLPAGRIVAAEIMNSPSYEMRLAIGRGDEKALWDAWLKQNSDNDIGITAMDHALHHVGQGLVCPYAVEMDLGVIGEDYF